MRTISYLRTEFHAENEHVENTLLAFVYDIPYFGACGVFPPFHIINQIFLGGGGDGGMGPGAAWKPFKITREEYNELKEAVTKAKPEMLKETSRFCDLQFEFDSEFDTIRDRLEWMEAMCNKHRADYHKRKL